MAAIETEIRTKIAEKESDTERKGWPYLLTRQKQEDDDERLIKASHDWDINVKKSRITC